MKSQRDVGFRLYILNYAIVNAMQKFMFQSYFTCFNH